MSWKKAFMKKDRIVPKIHTKSDTGNRETRKKIQTILFSLEALIQTGSHFESFTTARDQTYMCRAVGIGGQRGDRPPKILANTFTRFQSRGYRLWPENFYFYPPNFQTYLRSWYVVQSVRAKAHSADLCAIVTLSCTWSRASVPGMHPGGNRDAHVPSDSKQVFYWNITHPPPRFLALPTRLLVHKEDDKIIFTRIFLVELCSWSLLKTWL